ncbi:MAG: uroporphyrinogen decarboxylase [Deltaproteobacteria bacterium]|nr:uroporphyrinogen decarboxylase [Deltaproteobacteria bacterium]
MLTKRQNFMEAIRGGNPDRFVKQFEALEFIWANPVAAAHSFPVPGGPAVKDGWGVTIRFQANTPGPFPVHDDEHKVVKDITRWREVVKAPRLDYPQKAWDQFKPDVEAIDRNEVFATCLIAPGLFEQLHYLMGMEDCMISFYQEPEAMKELIEYITQYELDYAKLLCENFQPDALLHHDDWGSHRSSFLSPQMFNEFIVPAYKRIYGFYKANRVKIIVHHSDSYAANLVPAMIDVGIDVFQGCVTTNNVPALVKEYGGRISFMGDLDNGVIDRADWTPELVEREVRRACTNNGKLYFIPCLAAGGPGSTFPGVYDAVNTEIDKQSKEMF